MLSYKDLNVKIGLEIHQQLATEKKLFCSCKSIEIEKHEHEFFRRLRPTQSELGEYDPAALFEFKKGRIIRYIASNNNSCLVEADEEPPHDLNSEALDIALTIAMLVNSDIVDEVHAMRKIVIDGSNTTGFQRTMLIALGGTIDGVTIQSISLEEDAAKIIDENEKIKSYSLDRLGVPLIEISLEPVTNNAEEVALLALKIGRLLRATKRVARGLGTIRQDVNISIANGNVVEIKGVQRLDQLKDVIEYEVKRQHGLMIIADMLKERIDHLDTVVKDVTSIFIDSKSKIIINAIKSNGNIKAINIKGFAGMLGFEPYQGIRLGKELGEMVRSYGLGGIFHSDELPAYGISEEELNKVREILGTEKEDAIILIAGKNVEDAINAIIKRLEEALKGVPAETRAAKGNVTVYSRPRPGAARMYPETDIAPVVIRKELLEQIRSNLPKGWDEYIDELSSKYNINRIQAEKIFDSEYLNLFERIASTCKNIQPSFIVSLLTESMTSIEREGYDISILTDDKLISIFNIVNEQRIAKESIVDIIKIMINNRCSVDEAIKNLGLESISDAALKTIIEKIIMDNLEIVKEKGDQSFNILMGKAMDKLRGKVDGKKISILIKEKISQYK
ncbi:MAG: Glu-tRNA(Gln) amidotransferase subunit GatE [Candidatus Nitrosocaldaceae archaeon]